VRYYKFLDHDGVAPFSRHRWSTDWADVHDLLPCVIGLHVCRLEDLPYWLHEELWRVDVEGSVEAVGHKVVTRRARLAKRIDAWDADQARRLAVACAGRAALHASRECGDLDADGELAELGSALVEGDNDAHLQRLKAVARERQDSGARWGRLQAAVACGYVADAVELIDVYPVVASAYVAARAAAATTGSDDAYQGEREWQARWLADRLDLESD
jgi:hypothetical protein